MIYLGSFSKTFAPGFRVGWALAPHAVREKLVLAQESATLCPPSFSQLAVSAYLDNHDWLRPDQAVPGDVPRAPRRHGRGPRRHDARGSARGTSRTAGFYVWLTLPDGLDAKAMLPRAVTARVAYVPGHRVLRRRLRRPGMRLSYCYPTPERIREGVRRLVGVIEEELELRHTFGTDVGPAALREINRGYDGPGTDLDVSDDMVSTLSTNERRSTQ